MGDPQDWDPFVSHFSARYDCLTPHLNKNFDLPNKCHLVGYSMGGRVALDLLHKKPNHFLSVALLSTNLGLNDDKAKEARAKKEKLWIEQIQSSSIEEFVNSWYRQELFQGLEVPSIRYKQKKENLIELIEKFSLAKSPSFWNSYTNLNKPLLFLYGEKDRAYQEICKKVKGKIIPGSTHAIHLQDPKSCIKHMEDFYGNLGK